MRLQQVSPVISSHKRNQIAFKSDLVSVDLGASNPKGNARVNYMDKKGKTLFSYKSALNYSADRFKDNDDFVTKLAELIDPETTMTRELTNKNKQLLDASLPAKTQKKLESEIAELKNNLDIYSQRTPEEKKLRGIELDLPGTMQGKRALIIPNLKDANNHSLENIPLDQMLAKLKQLGKIKVERQFSLERNFMPIKDLGKTAAIAASKVINDPKLGARFDKGCCMSVVHCGGGWGAATVDALEDDLLMIRTSESGHDIYYDYKTKKPIRLGAMGASVPSVIENYAKKLGVTNADEIKALQATGFAHMATQKQLDLSTEGHKNAIDILLKTGAYKIENKGPEITTLKVKDLDKFNKASRTAIKAFADTVAQFGISRINRGFNILLVSGPLAMGLDTKLKEEPIKVKSKDASGKQIVVTAHNMQEAIWARINKYTATDNTVKLYIKEKNFEIVCDKALSVVDNNEGGAFFLSGETKTLAKRGEIIVVPKGVLKDLSKYTDPSIGDMLKKPIKAMLQKALKHL